MKCGSVCLGITREARGAFLPVLLFCSMIITECVMMTWMNKNGRIENATGPQ